MPKEILPTCEMQINISSIIILGCIFELSWPQ